MKGVCDDQIGLKDNGFETSQSKTNNLPFSSTGIVDSPLDSLFTYQPGETWNTFYDPYFIPIYEPTFSSPEAEANATMLCGDDTECLYDVAATGRMDIGQVVVDIGNEIEETNELQIPGST